MARWCSVRVSCLRREGERESLISRASFWIHSDHRFGSEATDRADRTAPQKSQLLTWNGDHVHESLLVQDASSGTATLLSLLDLLLHFRGLALHFTGTSQRTVHFTAQQSGGHFDLTAVGQTAERCIVQNVATDEDHLILDWKAFFGCDELLKSADCVSWAVELGG